MTSVNSVTRQIAALEISSKPNTQHNTTRTAGTAHQKKPSQSGPNVTKLLNKFAAPQPFTSGTAKAVGTSQTTTNTATTTTTKARPASPTKLAKPSAPSVRKQPTIDIGSYDGGLELDDENRGEKVTGEAAEALALDSSVAR